MITTTQLEYLVAVDRYGSFSKAAARCFVTQPTLSMQIQKLEAELAVSLFDRGRKPVQATPLAEKGIRETALFYEPLHGYVSAGHRLADKKRLSTGELAADEMIMLGSGHCLYEQAFRLCTGRMDMGNTGSSRLRFVGGSLAGLMRIVESGHGVTLLPELAAMTLLPSFQGLLRPFEPPVPAREVSLITHGEGVKTRLLEILRRSILKGVPDRLKKKDRNWDVIGAKSA